MSPKECLMNSNSKEQSNSNVIPLLVSVEVNKAFPRMQFSDGQGDNFIV